MDILIIGGTMFFGRDITELALENGHNGLENRAMRRTLLITAIDRSRLPLLRSIVSLYRSYRGMHR
jgi:hypothetical protein